MCVDNCLGYLGALFGANFGATFLVMIFWAIKFGLVLWGGMILGLMMFGVMIFGLMISRVMLLGVMEGVVLGALFWMFCFGDCLNNSFGGFWDNF